MLCIDLFCGLGGWAEGFLAEGYDVIGFDNVARPYPSQLVLQDVLTLCGSQFRGADAIVASPPCTEYSYMAMPWTRGKQIAAALRGEVPFPDGYEGSRTPQELTALFAACFRIRREASEAAGRYIPLVVENVRGAQPWVGQSKARFGSYYLWGDVESVGQSVVAGELRFGSTVRARGGRKVPGFRFDGSGRSFQTASVEETGINLTNPGEHSGVKMDGTWWHDSTNNLLRKCSSKSNARIAATAQIAKIPFPLARYIARAFKGWDVPKSVTGCPDEKATGCAVGKGPKTPLSE